MLICIRETLILKAVRIASSNPHLHQAEEDMVAHQRTLN